VPPSLISYGSQFCRGDLTGKVEENLRKAATKFAQTGVKQLCRALSCLSASGMTCVVWCGVGAGDFAKYCSLMVEVGDWKAALAMAPA
jgi:hypothetical protein